MEFHIQPIEDIFIDVKDEFNMYRYDPSKISRGLFYNILMWQMSTQEIRLWIGNISEAGIKLSDDIKKSQELKDFEVRLKNMGYTFKMGSMPYYEIFIRYNNI